MDFCRFRRRRERKEWATQLKMLYENAHGGFYATQDADSEGEKAKFFVWTPDEIRAVLGDRADRFIEVYGRLGSRKPHYLSKCYSLTLENIHLTTEWLEKKILVLGSTDIIYEL
jgi:uncharacterized protein YyaL (SSP411 family)